MSEAPHALRTGRWIRGRVFTLALFGSAASLALVAWSGFFAVAELRRHTRSERELRATLTAERVNRLLTYEQERLETLAAAIGLSGADAGALRQFQLHDHELFERVLLLDRGGALVVSEPAGWTAADGPLLAKQALLGARPLFTGLVGPLDAPRLYAVVPVKAPSGTVSWVLAAAMRPETALLSRLLKTGELPEGTAVDLIDPRGVVLASTDPTRRYVRCDRASLFAGMIRDRRAASGDCHDCHLGSGPPVQEEFAFAPLSIAPWGVTVRQSQAAARAFERSLAERVAAAGGGLVLTVMLFAYGASLSLTRPLGALTHAAERLAKGDLAGPLPQLPGDEVGRLAVALEQMRTSLRRTNEELEARVEDRTRELARVNRELKKRAASRADALRKVISAQEDERKRLARELHDETSQSLAALAIHLDALGKSAPSPEVRARVAEASALAVRTLDEVHRLCVFLRPSVLDDLGLGSALQWYADHALLPRGLSVRCEFSGLEERLPPQLETAVFRCAQEAMTNIARHAEAETVLVQCARRAGRLTLEIEDDGKGFVPEAVQVPDAKGRGLGLLGIRERVELLGGSLTLASAPGRGTHLTITLPLEEEARHDEGPGHPR